MKELQDRIRQLQARIDDAVEAWAPFADDCDSDWVDAVRRYKVGLSGPIKAGDLDAIEAERGFRFPAAYRAFLEAFGHVTIGGSRVDGSSGGSEELCLFAPQGVYRTYADYLQDAEFPDEDNRLTYEPYLVFAEDGTFPNEIRDYSRVLAFHRDNPDLMLNCSSDEMGYQAPLDARENPDYLTVFLAEALDSIEEHASEALEGLAGDIEFYANDEDQ